MKVTKGVFEAASTYMYFIRKDLSKSAFLEKCFCITKMFGYYKILGAYQKS